TEYLESYILENNLKAHDRLPPERELSQMWNMNRVTLRSAIASMEAAGRLYSVQGRGTMVAPRFVRTLQNLESFTKYASHYEAKSETRLLSFSKVECDKHLAQRFQRMLGEKLYRISRLRILDGVPIMIENAFIPCDLVPGLEEHDLVKGSLFAVLERSYGLIMDHGEEKASITAATAEEAEYLEIKPDSPAFWIVSTTRTPDDVVVEYCRTVARVDVVEMSSVLRWDYAGGADHE
ncbi:MAG: GntR family transcriptional regulator, partial [Eubacteriales bacterium]|nr:GntR family transcriptional regulator [Eubacteriales bacterium]